jgi:hypothetical protein
MSSTETLQAIAVASGGSNSAVASAAYTMTSSLPAATAPTFSPAAGTYTSAQSVTIHDATSDATIYYTTNGTTPSTSSTKYTGPITVSSTETLQAIAVASGNSNSAVASTAYTITSPSASSQTVINYPNGFAGSSGQIWLQNNATLSGSSIHLVPSTTHNASNAWFKTVENEQAFTTTFTFHIACTADPSDCGGGFGFMMICKCSGGNPVYGGSNNLPGYTYSGFSGAQFSWSQCAQPLTPASTYCYNSSDGNNGSSDLKQLPDNIIVTFNNYNNNPPGTPGASLTTYATNGIFAAAPVTTENNMAPSGIDLNSGHEFSATITYNGSTLTESLTDTVTNANYTHTYTGVNIPAAITGNTAFIGFGGGTGAAVDDVYLDSWTYTVE